MSSGSSSFASVIEEHLELKRRNQALDSHLPLDDFVGADPFHNHPLFKTEAEAQREEEETGEHPAVRLEMPAEDTVAMERIDDSEPQAEGKGWMETTTAGEFSWD
jgi:hypothetical protein